MEFSSVAPIYLQLRDYYKKLIERGLLKNGEALPSVREVALAEGINPNTVVRAYLELMNEGYISSLPKKGYFVTYKGPVEKDDKLTQSLELLLQQYSFEEVKQALTKIGAKND